jgi:hypothetical protein
MKTRDIVTGLIVLVVLIAGVLLIRNARNKSLTTIPSPTPSVSEQLSKTFPGLNIPAGTETADLKDVTGGNAMGVATRTEIIANLPALTGGKFYQGFLENSQGRQVPLGTLRLTKSGWMVSYNSSKYPGYNKVIVETSGKHILEGSF